MNAKTIIIQPSAGKYLYNPNTCIQSVVVRAVMFVKCPGVLHIGKLCRLLVMVGWILQSSSAGLSDQDAEADDEFECDCSVCQQNRRARQRKTNEYTNSLILM